MTQTVTRNVNPNVDPADLRVKHANTEEQLTGLIPSLRTDPTGQTVACSGTAMLFNAEGHVINELLPEEDAETVSANFPMYPLLGFKRANPRAASRLVQTSTNLSADGPAFTSRTVSTTTLLPQTTVLSGRSHKFTRRKVSR